jgi:hypothetical protein
VKRASVPLAAGTAANPNSRPVRPVSTAQVSIARNNARFIDGLQGGMIGFLN